MIIQFEFEFHDLTKMTGRVHKRTRHEPNLTCSTPSRTSQSSRTVTLRTHPEKAGKSNTTWGLTASLATQSSMQGLHLHFHFHGV